MAKVRGFGKEDRIRLRCDFDGVRRFGASARGRLLTLYARPNGAGRPRLGIAVSKAVGNAVTRNRVKRWIREAFRTGRDAFAGGRDMLVVARGAAAAATSEQIARELCDLDARLAQRGSAPGRDAGAVRRS